jgi:hypothetical protein
MRILGEAEIRLKLSSGWGGGKQTVSDHSGTTQRRIDAESSDLI